MSTDFEAKTCPEAFLQERLAGVEAELQQAREERTALLVNEQNLREELAALRASLGEPAQWQKRHPNRDGGAWTNTNEHDAKWWKANGTADWEIRALYAHPVSQMPEHKGMTIAGNGAQELGALMREQWAARGGLYPDGNPNTIGKA